MSQTLLTVKPFSEILYIEAMHSSWRDQLRATAP
jgi:hypothetical protein